MAYKHRQIHDFFGRDQSSYGTSEEKDVSKAKIPLGSSRHVSTQLDMLNVSIPCILAVSSLSNSTAQHARHNKLDWLDTWTCRVVSRRDATSQLEFVLKKSTYRTVASRRLHTTGLVIANATCRLALGMSVARYCAFNILVTTHARRVLCAKVNQVGLQAACYSMPQHISVHSVS